MLVIPTPNSSSPLPPKYLCEGPRLLKGHLLLEHVVAGASQLMGDCLGGNRPVRLGLLALIKLSNPLVITHGEMRRLDKGPGQVLVAVLAV